MITFDKTHLVISENEITSRKIDTVIVTFASTVKGLLTSTIDGYETSILEGDEEGETRLTLIQKNLVYKDSLLSDFEGKDILEELHKHYKTELEKLNPSLIFTISEL